MIQLLSVKYKKTIAWPLIILFYLQILMPVYVAGSPLPLRGTLPISVTPGRPKATGNYNTTSFVHENKLRTDRTLSNALFNDDGEISMSNPTISLAVPKPEIGGPSSPESHAFKAVGSDNLVNLFTGDFSYSIPLLDVGGYPVNLFYSGGITMEQEASWVGLGWNINPGTVSRNMRGVPDDFNGEDLLTQKQNTKPNRTWGGEVGINGELIGIPKPKINLTLGFSYNNYLGPALDLGASVSLTVPIFENVKAEKSAPTSDSLGGGIDGGLNLGLGAKLSSRSGLTFSPSLGANLSLMDGKMDLGVKLSTSYNSRTGIKDLNISSQTSAYRQFTDKEEKPQSSSIQGTIGSTTISFARPSYVPTLRMPMENANYSGQLELGGGMFGIRGGGTASGYYSESKVPAESRIVKKPLVGFIYSENAINNKDAVMDFNRVNDGEVTPNTPIISAPQYAYDIFSIQGEGTGGTIRAYRGDMGFVRDNVTVSKDKNISIGFDIAPPGHYGGNWNIISMPTRVGGWEDANNTLHHTMAFRPKQSGSSFENVYFKNPGEATVTSQDILNRVGWDNLVRFKLGGSNVTPRLESQLEQFNKNTLSYKGPVVFGSNTNLPERDKRTQVVTMLNAEDASNIGLEKFIRNYTGTFNASNIIQYDSFPRVSEYRMKHHISEITVLEQGGMRYVYGIPVYSYVQKDFTFSVNSLPANPNDNLVSFTSTEPTISSEHMTNAAKLDGYVQSQETPAYASSFLITGLLSPDYVDVTGNGITEDDPGGAVKFNYTKSTGLHKWRTPRNNSSANLAHFNEGTRTEKKDNKATISYGEREAWYLSSIESKSMVAIFKTDSRNDAKGVYGEMDARVNTSENINKKLARIDLYTKAEIKSKGINLAKPIKSVHFEYSYALCPGTPDSYPAGGKLTLKSVYFSYNGQTRQSKDRYIFNYGDTLSAVDNPSYVYNASDRWGTYKNVSSNPSSLTNSEYPYTSGNKTQNDQYAGAWSLKKILLPSGGQMEVQYEADDYAYVQNRRACDMYNVFGLGKTTDYTTSNAMYTLGLSSLDNLYVYVQLPQALESTNPAKYKEEIYSKYLEGIKQIAFRLQINMPKGPEPLTVYTEYEDYGLCPNSVGKNHIYIKLKAVEGKSPLAKSSIGFLTENIPGQAFPGYDIEVNGVAAFIEMVGSMLGSLKNAFKNVDQQMRDAAKGRTIVLAKSFVRLNNPAKMKYGGGVRVKRVMVKDNWNKMTGKYTSVYGQDYEYTTVEKINGVEKTISSGVASYEPGIGSEENPFREIVSFNNKLPLASAQFGAIEMPMLEALFPASGVGYSKVTVRSIHRKGTHGDSAVRSGIGKQVNEFYTAREYPTYAVHTPLAVMDYNKKPLLSLFYKEIINRRTLSQGFLVETNDMHGKIKSQVAYSESDEKTPISGSFHTYKNTGRNGLNDKIDYVFNGESGAVRPGNMGIDVELMTDIREFRIISNGFNGQIQTDFFTFVPWPIFIVPMLPLKTYTENKYRAVTCTKLINYHAIEDSVIILDKGSVVSSKTIAYDSETGAPLLTQTANEFNDPVYNVSYPGYWAYSGMAPAYRNVGLEFTGVSFYDGKIISGVPNQNVFESGDEIYIRPDQQGGGSSGCVAASGNTAKLWAFDRNKNNTALTAPVKDLIFMDDKGRLFTKNNVSFRIVRSGYRNTLGPLLALATTMKNPIQNISGINKLVVDSVVKVLSATAMEYKEKWQTDKDVILRTTDTVINCIYMPGAVNCTGNLEKNINPYLKGLVGNHKSYRNYVFYGERIASDFNQNPLIRKNGYLKSFINFWAFNGNGYFVPDTLNPKWVWNSELTKMNARGQELETKDPQNRYTAAQHGFNKNLTVALTQNSRYGEAMNDGFEDYNYVEAINNTFQNTCNRFIDFSGLANGSIINAESSALKAHTGKYVLKVNPGSSVTKPIINPMKTTAVIYDAFSLATKADTVKSLTNIGVNISNVWTYPVNSFGPNSIFTTGGGGMHLTINPLYDTIIYNGNGFTRSYDYSVTTQHYSIIPTEGEYFFESAFTRSGGAGAQPYINMGFTIFTLDGETISPIFVSQSNDVWRFKACLKPGIYSILCYAIGGMSYTCVENPPWENCIPYAIDLPQDDFYFYFTNATIDAHTTITTQNGCVSTRPIAANDSMLNASFNLIPGKRMQFSAWVKEECGNPAGTPCYTTQYQNVIARIQFPAMSSYNVNLVPTGPIIEGWQKIEGEFTVPNGDILSSSFQANLVFSNTGSMNAYVDDVRIHPFNSNMKSYVYDARNLRLSAELDLNNYATFYDYNEEGQLIRIKKETVQGIKTIKETRNAKQKIITDF